MKKVYLFLICFLLLGCSKPSVYDTYVKSLKQEQEASTNIPFEVSFYVDEVNEKEWIYQVVIDHAQKPMEVRALVVHNGKTKHIYPSIGIVDDMVTLNEETKGINLVGYVDKQEEIEFKVLIETNNDKYIVFYNYR